MTRPKLLLVLAGGFGTRLRAVVSDVPKPLAPVAGQPYLHYLIENWIAQGVTRMTFLLHHQAELIETFLANESANGCLQGCEVNTITEPRPLGTGGAIAYAVREGRLTDPFLVANADTWLSSGIAATSEATAPALGVVSVGNSARFGNVSVAEGKVVAFEEKRTGGGDGWVNAGLYHLRPELFHDWNGAPFSAERDLFPTLAAKSTFQAVRLDTDFMDIGVPDDYQRFCNWIESGRSGRL